MKETEKRKNIYQTEGYFSKYFNGKGIDIGCGDNPVLPSERCLAFDRCINPSHDANTLSGIKDGSFDWVFSSHCLEHTIDPKKALANWWRVLKADGHLIVIVPDAMLYEQFMWPSNYNMDHKHCFSFGEHPTLQKHWSIASLVEGLPGAQIRSALTRDVNYDYSERWYDRTLSSAFAELEVVVKKLGSPFWDKSKF